MPSQAHQRGTLRAPHREADPERRAGEQDRRRPLQLPGVVLMLLRAVPDPRERGQTEHPKRDRRRRHPVELPLLRPVDDGAGEHHRQDHAAGPREGVVWLTVTRTSRPGRERRPCPGRPGPRCTASPRPARSSTSAVALSASWLIRRNATSCRTPPSAGSRRAPRRPRRRPSRTSRCAGARPRRTARPAAGRRPSRTTRSTRSDGDIDAGDDVLHHEQPAERRGRGVLACVRHRAVPDHVGSTADSTSTSRNIG